MPPGVGLHIISKTMTNVDRIRLFHDLGVREAPISLVRSKILGIYGQPGDPPNMSLQTSKQHLIFLYLTQHLKSVDEASYADIVLLDKEWRMVNPSKVLVSMPTMGEDPYSPWLPVNGRSCNATPPGITPHHFLNDWYFSNTPQKPLNQAHTWIQWLHIYLNISRYAPVAYPDRSVSGEHMQEHGPEISLMVFQVHVHQDSQLAPEFITHLQNTMVLCRGDQDSQEVLKNTFFPTRKLEDLVDRFLEPCTFFPFLRTLPEIAVVGMTIERQMFLSKVGVGIPRTDLEFALHLLRYSVRALKPGYSSRMSISRLFSLYNYIQEQHQKERGGGGEEDETIRCVHTSPMSTRSDRHEHAGKYSQTRKLFAFRSLPPRITTFGLLPRNAFGM